MSLQVSNTIRIKQQRQYLFTRSVCSLFFSLLFLHIYTTSRAQERKSFIPRTIDWGYKIVQGDSAHPYKKYIFAVPIIAYRPESKWIFGVSLAHIFRTKKDDQLTRPSTIRCNISYSQMKQFSVKPFIEFFSHQNRLNIRSQSQYTNFGEFYWGLGPYAPDANKEFYTFSMLKGNIKVAWRFNTKLYAGLQYVYEKMYAVSYETGSQLQTSNVVGSHGYMASGPGFCLYSDTRDNIYFPYNGHFVEVSGTYFNSAFGSASNFSNYTLDARKYIQWYNENIIAVQAYLSSNSGSIPFRMLGTLGSDMIMRGYYNGRLRDHHALAIQAELRKTIWGPIGCVFFAGAGSVNRTFGTIAQDIRPNYGLGLRVKAIPRERLNMRIDIGFGNKNIQAFYITLNEAF